jgi:hypothetical protein
LIIGCDLHTRYQVIAMLDTETGEVSPDLSTQTHLAATLLAKSQLYRRKRAQIPGVDCGIQKFSSTHTLLSTV